VEPLDHGNKAVHSTALEGETIMSATAGSARGQMQLWPLFAAPLVAGMYYLSLRAAFSLSIETSVDTIRTAKSELANLISPEWGSHWLYRVAAEFCAVCFATVVAGGLARGREPMAAMVGGSAISLGFLVRVVFLILAWTHDQAIAQSWYQSAIDGFMVIACPCIAYFAADAAGELNDSQTSGFAGVNRLHFLWLWVAAFWYALGLVSPVFHFYVLQYGYFEGYNPFAELTIIITLIMVDVVPVSALLVPAYYGLALLSGRRGTSLHPLARNLLGIVVLVIGFVIGACIQIGWQTLFQWLLY
jgi:hypothetical protein